MLHAPRFTITAPVRADEQRYVHSECHISKDLRFSEEEIQLWRGWQQQGGVLLLPQERGDVGYYQQEVCFHVGCSTSSRPMAWMGSDKGGFCFVSARGRRGMVMSATEPAVQRRKSGLARDRRS